MKHSAVIQSLIFSLLFASGAQAALGPLINGYGNRAYPISYGAVKITGGATFDFFAQDHGVYTNGIFARTIFESYQFDKPDRTCKIIISTEGKQKIAVALRDQAFYNKNTKFVADLDRLLDAYDAFGFEIKYQTAYPDGPKFDLSKPQEPYYADGSSAELALNAYEAKYFYTTPMVLSALGADFACAFGGDPMMISNEYKFGNHPSKSDSPGVVQSFIIQAPSFNSQQPADSSSVDLSSLYSLQYLVLLQDSKGFQFSLTFAKPVTSLNIFAIRIATPELKPIPPTQQKSQLLSILGTPQGPITSFQGMALFLNQLDDGYYKIRVDYNVQGSNQLETYWQPQDVSGKFNNRLLDGTLAIFNRPLYKNKKDFENAIEPKVYDFIYGATDGPAIYQAAQLAKSKQSQMDLVLANLQKFSQSTSGSSEQFHSQVALYFTYLGDFGKAKENVLDLTMKNDPPKKTIALKTLWQKIWLERLPFYLENEKRLTDRQMALCHESLWDQSLLTWKFYSALFSKLQGKHSCPLDPGETVDSLELRKSYLDYMSFILSDYLKLVAKANQADQTPHQTLEQTITDANQNYLKYLEYTYQSAETKLVALENQYQKKNQLYTDYDGNAYVAVSGHMLSAGHTVDRKTVNVKISDKTCNIVNSMLAIKQIQYDNPYNGYGDSIGIDLAQSVEYDPLSLDAQTTYKFIDYLGFQTLQQFCQPYAQGNLAYHLIQLPDAQHITTSQLPTDVISINGPNSDYSSQNAAINSKILTRLASDGLKLNDPDVYETFTNLNNQLSNPTQTSTITFNECIRPFSSPAFVGMTAAFIVGGTAATVATGGAAAPAVETLGYAMLVQGGIQLYLDKAKSPAQKVCDAAGLITGAALTLIKKPEIKQVNEELKAQGDDSFTTAIQDYLRQETSLPDPITPTNIDETLTRPQNKGREQSPIVSEKQNGQDPFCLAPCSGAQGPNDPQGTSYYSSGAFTTTRFTSSDLPVEGQPRYISRSNNKIDSFKTPGTHDEGVLFEFGGNYFFRREDSSLWTSMVRINEQGAPVDEITNVGDVIILRPGEGVKIDNVIFRMPDAEPLPAPPAYVWKKLPDPETYAPQTSSVTPATTRNANPATKQPAAGGVGTQGSNPQAPFYLPPRAGTSTTHNLPNPPGQEPFVLAPRGTSPTMSQDIANIRSYSGPQNPIQPSNIDWTTFDPFKFYELHGINNKPYYDSKLIENAISPEDLSRIRGNAEEVSQSPYAPIKDTFTPATDNLYNLMLQLRQKIISNTLTHAEEQQLIKAIDAPVNSRVFGIRTFNTKDNFEATCNKLADLLYVLGSPSNPNRNIIAEARKVMLINFDNDQFYFQINSLMTGRSTLRYNPLFSDRV